MQTNFTMEERLTYDDVLLLPRISSVGPTDGLTVTRFSKNVELDVPIASAPMDTVTELSMAVEMAKLGGIGVLHRNMSIQQAVEMVRSVKARCLKIAAAIGPFDHERARALSDAGADAILIDAAHGGKQDIAESARQIKAQINCDLVCGSVATAECAELYCQFADALRVGVGPGSICTMRVVTGVGVPQLFAITEVCKIATRHGVPVIADGGIRTSGDIAKALAAGASSVMLGNMLAGMSESPSELIEKNGVRYKRYRGMGSSEALSSHFAADRYGQSADQDKVSMGVSGLVQHKGPLARTIAQLVGGIKATMGLIGASTIDEMRSQAHFVRISRSGLLESHPHSLHSYNSEKNYD